jgi:hypothetical protein
VIFLTSRPPISESVVFFIREKKMKKFLIFAIAALLATNALAVSDCLKNPDGRMICCNDSDGEDRDDAASVVDGMNAPVDCPGGQVRFCHTSWYNDRWSECEWFYFNIYNETFEILERNDKWEFSFYQLPLLAHRDSSKNKKARIKGSWDASCKTDYEYDKGKNDCVEKQPAPETQEEETPQEKNEGTEESGDGSASASASSSAQSSQSGTCAGKSNGAVCESDNATVAACNPVVMKRGVAPVLRCVATSCKIGYELAKDSAGNSQGWCKVIAKTAAPDKAAGSGKTADADKTDGNGKNSPSDADCASIATSGSNPHAVGTVEAVEWELKRLIKEADCVIASKGK